MVATATTLRERAADALVEERRREAEEARQWQDAAEACAREFFCAGMQRLFGITLETSDITATWNHSDEVRVGVTLDGLEFTQGYGVEWFRANDGQQGAYSPAFYVWDSTVNDAVQTFVRSLADLGQYLEAVHRDH